MNPTCNSSGVHTDRAPFGKAEPTDGDEAVEEFLALLAVQFVVMLAETVVRYVLPALRPAAGSR